jgi:hypothetical protein
MVKNSHLNGAFSSHRRRLAFLVHNNKPGRDMAHLRLVPKRAPTRHELEQQLDALAREYGVSKDKRVFEQMLEVCRRMEVLMTTGEY